MKIQKFEEILSWQKSKELAVKIYRIFRDNKDLYFKNQIQRAVISISSNIAEGFERSTNKELTHFLFISKGSCAEVRSQLYIALDLKYISSQEFNILYKELIEIAKLLSGLIKHLSL